MWEGVKIFFSPQVLPYLLGIIAIVVIFKLLDKAVLKNKKDDASELKTYPYKKKYILTKNEYYFYKKLKEICDNHNLRILVKTRLADIVDVDKSKIESKEYMKYYSRIQSKHIDFLLCNGDSLYPVVAIELDDNSHDSKERQTRDNFVNKTFESADIPLIRCKGAGNLETLLKDYLKAKE